MPTPSKPHVRSWATCGSGALFGLAILAFQALATPAAESVETEPARQSALEILGELVEPGEKKRLALGVSESFTGAAVYTPVIVIRSALEGPTLCMTGAVHGDEVNGVEIVRRTVADLEPDSIRGTVIAVPIVNLSAFRRSSRYLPDRRDLNRFFPGRTWGSAASRIAFGIFEGVVHHCSVLVDLHTGSFHRTNLHQLRADLTNPDVAELAKGFGSPIVVHNQGRQGTLRRAATEAGIPAITLEAGEPGRLSEREIRLGVAGIKRLFIYLGMVDGKQPKAGKTQEKFQRARWIRSSGGGILTGSASLGDWIKKDQLLGTVTDPLTDEQSEIRSPFPGRLIGKAFDQLVMPGFAAYHIAIPGDPAATNGRPTEDVSAAPHEDEDLELDERPE